MEISFYPTKKQDLALEYLEDNETTEVLFGGAASGAKTFLGCAWIIISCLKYPETRWLIGRSKLNTLKGSTLKTFIDILKMWQITHKFKINYQTNTITCTNGSEILMKDLFAYPSDPEFDSLGSLEITGAFIDEANQISSKAFEIVKTRIRYKLTEYKIKGKCLASCNPSKGWVYTTFYKPYIDNTLPTYRKFVPALASDNPYSEPAYIESLQRASEAVKQRLLYGNWQYSDDIDSLFTYQTLLSLRHMNKEVKTGVMYITADIARFGKDSTIIIIWNGLMVIDIIELNQVDTNVSANKIKELQLQYNIASRNIIIDADGIGGGTVDNIPNVTPFNNGNSPIQNNEPNIYQNLKSQCYYKLAELIERDEIKIANISSEQFELLTQELQVIKQKNIDQDGKLQVIPKEQMKKILSRSPDYADALMMRMLVELYKTPSVTPVMAGPRKTYRIG